MSNFQKRLAVYQVLHTSAVAVGATFLALGITFFALQLNYIMAVMSTLTNDKIISSSGAFMKYSIIFIASGMVLILVSTILTTVAIKKYKIE